MPGNLAKPEYGRVVEVETVEQPLNCSRIQRNGQLQVYEEISQASSLHGFIENPLRQQCVALVDDLQDPLEQLAMAGRALLALHVLGRACPECLRIGTTRRHALAEFQNIGFNLKSSVSKCVRIGKVRYF